jgi:hypothetical protein
LEQAEASKAREIARINREWQVKVERRLEADRGVREAGSVAKWYLGMTAAQREKWQDLKDELLREERRRQKSLDEALARQEPLTIDKLDLMMPGNVKPDRQPDVSLAPAQIRQRQPVVETGILEVDLAQYPHLDMSGYDHIARARYKELMTGSPDMDQRASQPRSGGACGFDDEREPRS